MFRWQQLAASAGCAAARLGLDGLLAHARRHRSPTLLSELLAVAIAMRIHGRGRDAEARETVQLLTELRARAERAGNNRLLADASTLRAHYNTIFRGRSARRGQDPLVDVATALDLLTEITGSGPDEDGTTWARSLSRSLDLLIQALLALGVHEIADEVSRQATLISDAAGGLDRLAHQLGRVRLQLSWGLRLERGGREAAAAGRLVGAAQAAHDAARLWGPAFDRHGADASPVARECPVIGAAYAFQRPGREHLDTLAALMRTAHRLDDRAALAIATARCLLADQRPEAAMGALAPMRAELGDRGTETVFGLALHREFARADAGAHEAAEPSGRYDAGRFGAVGDAQSRYTAVLEGELQTLHAAGISALRGHRENHRLTREHGVLTRKHGAVTAQLMEDPLTGLPNRRALDLQLAAATSDASQPCAVALIDLDRFKDVNDGRSHAVGDNVLRKIATTVRAALRSQDVVARYGGDEFVVIMPATPLGEAKAALARATQAVAELPPEAASGVTMSVGVVRAERHGEPAATLAAADAAMYQAKRQGGNQVVTAPPVGFTRAISALAEIADVGGEHRRGPSDPPPVAGRPAQGDAVVETVRAVPHPRSAPAAVTPAGSCPP